MEEVPALPWSTYTLLFRTGDRGGFCYNALSNTLIELDEAHYRLVEAYRDGRMPPDAGDDGLVDLLRRKHVLVEDGEEEDLLLARHHRRQAACFDTSSLGLAVCPTLRCNFRCPYCYEADQEDGGFMSASTRERLVAWIGRHESIRSLSVSWYGGEPLLAFDTIRALTERFLALGLAYRKARLVTNGYLLDDEKIARLDELRIESVQITLDGPREVHDSRRVLAGGGPTFERILGNVAALMGSGWSGTCGIRVNVDRHNLGAFLELRAELLERFAGTRLSVYPGRVDVTGDQAYDACACLDTEEWADFALELADRRWVFPVSGLHPGGFLDGTCVATRLQGFVVGPAGELYKCWDDVGRPQSVVGSVCAEETTVDAVLQARYVTGVDPYADPECLACKVLPVCGGGCAHRRLLVRYEGREGIDHCSPYKTRLRDFLEAYVRAVRSRESCTALLQDGPVDAARPAYRVISPRLARSPAAAGEGQG